MSDLQLPPESPDDPPGIVSLRNALKAEREAREAAETKALVNEEAARKVLFLEAGVDTESAIGQFFMQNYDGEATVDAVTTVATGLGALRGSAPPTDEDRDRQAVTAALTGDGASAAEPLSAEADVDLIDEGYAAFNKRLARGDTRERASAEVFDRLIDGAVRGDPQAVYDPDRWRRERGTFG
jgi:hypothetical protein